jgi:hypothetical protein
MKLFQQLLVAPAALGLLSPIAVSAAELNLDGVNRYASEEEQVTSITQFSDVRPTDWAFQALSNLIERYGCVAGYPDGTFRGSQAMTRYEAAALLNACLDRITEVTDELKRLMKEFEKELAILRGRVDGLEAKVGELEATQFSTTTKLKGTAYFVIGANTYSGDFKTTPLAAAFSGARLFKPDGDGGFERTTYADEAAALQGATAFNYDLRIDLDTSFTGKDLLRTRLRAGNFGDGPWGGPAVGLNALEVNFEMPSGEDNVGVNRLFYQFPIGSGFTATIGPRVRQDDMLAMWPSAYPADTILDIFTYGGAPGTYSLNLGAGGGLWWKSGGFSISANYVSANGNNGSPNEFVEDCGGIGNDCSAQTGTVQIAYGGSNFGLAAAYTYTNPQGGQAGLYGGNATPFANATFGLADSVNSFGVSGYWTPFTGRWFPSISAGWGINTLSQDDPATISTENLDATFDIDGATSQSWYVGLQWSDFLIRGNSFGMAVGQPTFITSIDNTRATFGGNEYKLDANDGQYAWEWWYKFQVTDNISVTPAIFYLSAPLGQFQRVGDNGDNGNDDSFSNFGGLVKTTFKF